MLRVFLYESNNIFFLYRLLDAEDVDTVRPDEKSILTYVASYYHTFARMKNEQKSGKRIANVSVILYSSKLTFTWTVSVYLPG